MKGKIMKISKQYIELLVVILFFGIVGIANADIVEFPLDCAGQYNFDSPYWSSDFYLGYTFTEISQVYIDWDGEITGGMAVQLDPQTLEPLGEPFPMIVEISAYLGSNPYLRSTNVWGGAVTYPDPEPFDCLSEFELYGGSTWSDLLDGTGTIIINYGEAISINGYYTEHGSIALDSATLIVDGVIVPEPTVLLFISIGVIGLRCKRHQGLHRL